MQSLREFLEERERERQQQTLQPPPPVAPAEPLPTSAGPEGWHFHYQPGAVMPTPVDREAERLMEGAPPHMLDREGLQKRLREQRLAEISRIARHKDKMAPEELQEELSMVQKLGQQFSGRLEDLPPNAFSHHIGQLQENIKRARDVHKTIREQEKLEEDERKLAEIRAKKLERQQKEMAEGKGVPPYMQTRDDPSREGMPPHMQTREEMAQPQPEISPEVQEILDNPEHPARQFVIEQAPPAWKRALDSAGRGTRVFLEQLLLGLNLGVVPEGYELMEPQTTVEDINAFVGRAVGGGLWMWLLGGVSKLLGGGTTPPGALQPRTTPTQLRPDAPTSRLPALPGQEAPGRIPVDPTVRELIGRGAERGAGMLGSKAALEATAQQMEPADAMQHIGLSTAAGAIFGGLFTAGNIYYQREVIPRVEHNRVIKQLEKDGFQQFTGKDVGLEGLTNTGIYYKPLKDAKGRVVKDRLGNVVVQDHALVMNAKDKTQPEAIKLVMEKLASQGQTGIVPYDTPVDTTARTVHDVAGLLPGAMGADAVVPQTTPPPPPTVPTTPETTPAQIGPGPEMPVPTPEAPPTPTPAPTTKDGVLREQLAQQAVEVPQGVQVETVTVDKDGGLKIGIKVAPESEYPALRETIEISTKPGQRVTDEDIFGALSQKITAPVEPAPIDPTPAPAVEEPVAPVEEPAPVAEPTSEERRKDTALRAEVEKLSPDEKDQVITDLRQMHFTDEMTGLKNRAAYMTDEKKPTQAVLDLDNLKWVNDNVGHQAGDQLIKQFADLLPRDAYHISGDEFIIQGESEEQLANLLSDIQNQAEQTMVDLGEGVRMGIGFSYGIDSTLEQAEKDLQKHKTARLEAGKRADRGEAPIGIAEPAPVAPEVDKAEVLQKIQTEMPQYSYLDESDVKEVVPRLVKTSQDVAEKINKLETDEKAKIPRNVEKELKRQNPELDDSQLKTKHIDDMKVRIKENLETARQLQGLGAPFEGEIPTFTQLTGKADTDIAPTIEQVKDINVGDTVYDQTGKPGEVAWVSKLGTSVKVKGEKPGQKVTIRRHDLRLQDPQTGEAPAPSPVATPAPARLETAQPIGTGKAPEPAPEPAVAPKKEAPEKKTKEKKVTPTTKVKELYNKSPILRHFGYWEDSATAKWMKEKRAEAKKKIELMDPQEGGERTFLGPATAEVTNVPLNPEWVMDNIAGGLNWEEKTRATPEGKKDIEKLTASIKEKGFDEKEAPFINVDRMGNAWMNEGWRRTKAAIEAGLESIPFRIRYFSGAERTDGVWQPDVLISEVKLPGATIKITRGVKNLPQYKEMESMLDVLQSNPYFKYVRIVITNRNTKQFYTKEELIERGYHHFEPGEYETPGQLHKLKGTDSTTDGPRWQITLNRGASKDTLAEEAVHYIERLIEEDKKFSKLGKMIEDWKKETRKKSEILNEVIPDDYELFAQAIVFSEMGYADANKDLAEMFSIPQKILDGMAEILTFGSEESLAVMMGREFPKTPRHERVLSVDDVSNHNVTQQVIDRKKHQLKKVPPGYEAAFFDDTRIELNTAIKTVERALKNNGYKKSEYHGLLRDSIANFDSFSTRVLKSMVPEKRADINHALMKSAIFDNYTRNQLKPADQWYYWKVTKTLMEDKQEKNSAIGWAGFLRKHGKKTEKEWLAPLIRHLESQGKKHQYSKEEILQMVQSREPQILTVLKDLTEEEDLKELHRVRQAQEELYQDLTKKLEGNYETDKINELVSDIRYYIDQVPDLNDWYREDVFGSLEAKHGKHIIEDSQQYLEVASANECYIHEIDKKIASRMADEDTQHRQVRLEQYRHSKGENYQEVLLIVPSIPVNESFEGFVRRDFREEMWRIQDNIKDTIYSHPELVEIVKNSPLPDENLTIDIAIGSIMKDTPTDVKNTLADKIVEKLPEETKELIQKSKNKYDKILSNYAQPLEDWLTKKEIEEYKKRYEEIHPEQRVINLPGFVKKEHFSEEDIVVFARISFTKDKDGNKILVVEELQSDWHQDGKKYGYQKVDTVTQGKELQRLHTQTSEFGRDMVQKYQMRIGDAKHLTPSEKKEWIDLKRQYDQLKKEVPPGYFSETWPITMLKRLTHMAVENDCDAVAIVDGRAHVEHWSSEYIGWAKEDDDSFTFFFNQHLHPEPIEELTEQQLIDINLADKTENTSIDDFDDLVAWLIGLEKAGRIYQKPEDLYQMAERMWNDAQKTEPGTIGHVLPRRNGLLAYYDKVVRSHANNDKFLNKHGKWEQGYIEYEDGHQQFVTMKKLREPFKQQVRTGAPVFQMKPVEKTAHIGKDLSKSKDPLAKELHAMRKPKKPDLTDLVNESSKFNKRQKAQINKLIKKVAKINTRKMRPEYRDEVTELLNEIEFTKLYKDPEKLDRARRIRQIRDALSHYPGAEIDEELLEYVTDLDKKPLGEMDYHEVMNTLKMVLNISTQNENANKLLIGGEIEALQNKVSEAVQNIRSTHTTKESRQQIEAIDSGEVEKVRTKFRKAMTVDTYMPNTLAQIMEGKPGIVQEIMYEEIDRGVTRQWEVFFEGLDNVKEAIDKHVGKKDLAPWSRTMVKRKSEADWQEINLPSGQKLKITKGERMAFYLHSKNEYNKRSLIDGGFVFRHNQRKLHKITEDDLQAILKSMTPEERRVANAMGDYLSKDMKKNINEVSVGLLGYEIATVENYWNIQRPKDHIRKDTGRPSTNFTYRILENMGILQPRQDVVLPLIIDDAFSTYLTNIQSSAAYVGLARPIRNARMLMNDQDFTRVLREEGLFHYHEALETYLNDIEGDAYKRSNIEGFGADLLGKLQKAILGGNIWIMFKQPLSYLLAGTEMESKHLVSALAKVPNWNEIAMYSPQLRVRLLGMVTREMGELAEIGKESSYLLEKMPLWDKFLGGIRAFDKAAVGRIWEAAKLETRDNQPNLKGDAFFEAVARRAEGIVNNTQPTYLPHTRSNIGRSSNLWIRGATAFTTQRNKNYNIFIREWNEYLNSEKKPKDKAKLTKALWLLLFSTVVLVGIDEARDKYYQRDRQSVGRLLARTLVTGLGNIYFLGNIADNMYQAYEKGPWGAWGFEDPMAGFVNDLIRGGMDVSNAISDVVTKEEYKSGYKENEEKWQTTIWKASEACWSILAKYKGIPYQNLKAISRATLKRASQETYFAVESATRNIQSTEIYTDFWRHIEEGDKNQAEESLKILREKYNTTLGRLENSARQRDMTTEQWQTARQLWKKTSD